MKSRHTILLTLFSLLPLHSCLILKNTKKENAASSAKERLAKDEPVLTDAMFEEEKGKFINFLNENAINLSSGSSKKEIFKAAKKYLKKVHHFTDKEIKELKPALIKAMKVRGFLGG